MSEVSKIRFSGTFDFILARRGGEGIGKMTKNTFKLKCDPENNFCYIVKVQDEETKNHKETDGPIITGSCLKYQIVRCAPCNHSYLFVQSQSRM